MRRLKLWMVCAVGIVVLFLAVPEGVVAAPSFGTSTELGTSTLVPTGMPFEISGTLRFWLLPAPSPVHPFPGGHVKIYRKVGSRPWKRIATLTTDAIGEFSQLRIVYKPGVQKYKALYSGNSTFRGSSDKVTITFFTPS
jgi:hypothetical protein